MRAARAALAAIPLSLALTIAVAPAASAQALPLPDPDTVVAEVEATAGAILSDATDTADEAVSEATQAVSETTEPLPDEVEEVVGTVTRPVESPVTGIVETIDETLPGTVGLIPDELTGPDNGGKEPGVSTATRSREPGPAVRGIRTAALADRGVDFGGLELAISAPPVEHDSSPSATEPSLLQQAGEAAIQGIIRVAFPLLLAIMVAAFLAFQGRVGRNDPKLVLAPLDHDQNTLTFR